MALLVATVVLPGATCGSTSLADAVIIRVDGTSLTDWERSSAMTDALAGSATGVLLLPAAVEDADRLPVPKSGPWYDEGLGGRRYYVSHLASIGARTTEIPAPALQTGQRPESLPAGSTGTFVASSPDGRPIAFGGVKLGGMRSDANWPTGIRANLDSMRSAISAGGPVELDVSDAWRTEHLRLTEAARTAFVGEALANVVAPLISHAKAAQRSVLIVSLLPSLAEQQGNRWRGAFAVVTPGVAGALSQPALPSDVSTKAGVARGRTMPGTLDVSRLLSSIGIPLSGASPLRPGDGLCVSDIAAQEVDESMATAASSHDPAGAALIVLLIASALGAANLVAKARRAALSRIALEVIATFALLLPLVATIEGSVGGPVAFRGAIWLVGIALAGAIVAFAQARTSLVIASAIGLLVSAIEIARQGLESSASLIAGPLFRGIRSEGPDPLLIASFIASSAVLLSWWIDSKPEGRAQRSLAAIPLVLIPLAGLFQGTLPPILGVVMVVAIVAPTTSLFSMMLPRASLLAGSAVLASAVSIWQTASLPADEIETIINARTAAQPDLWPLIAVGVILLLLVSYRLYRTHGDVLARYSFGSPAWRASEATMLLATPVVAFGMGAGIFAALVLSAFALLLGRIR